MDRFAAGCEENVSIVSGQPNRRVTGDSGSYVRGFNSVFVLPLFSR